MALYIVAGVSSIVILATLLLMAGSNPAGQRKAAIEAAQQKAVASLQAGSVQEGQQVVRAHVGDAPQAQPPSSANFNSDTLFNQPIVGKQPAAAGTSNLPSTSAATLADLDRAFQASQKPNFNSSGGGSHNGGLTFGGISDAVQSGTSGGMYEAYPKQSNLPKNGPESVGMAPTSAQPDANGQTPETFPVTKPLSSPSDRIIEQGTIIRAVLNGKVDTRNAGTVMATVTQNVYDSIDQSTVLVPKGTRLLGTYSMKVDAGSKRIPIKFRRMQLPGGRAVDLGGTDAVGYDGTAGVGGDYHSNILRAIGPSLVVALIGTAVDRLDNKRTPQAGPYGTVVQSPSIAEQMAPQVNSQVMSRYGSAMPYFIIDAGTEFKLVTQSDIVIPAAAAPSGRAAAGGSNVASMPQSGAWEAGNSNP